MKNKVPSRTTMNKTSLAIKIIPEVRKSVRSTQKIPAISVCNSTRASTCSLFDMSKATLESAKKLNRITSNDRIITNGKRSLQIQSFFAPIEVINRLDSSLNSKARKSEYEPLDDKTYTNKLIDVIDNFTHILKNRNENTENIDNSDNIPITILKEITKIYTETLNMNELIKKDNILKNTNNTDESASNSFSSLYYSTNDSDAKFESKLENKHDNKQNAYNSAHSEEDFYFGENKLPDFVKLNSERRVSIYTKCFDLCKENMRDVSNNVLSNCELFSQGMSKSEIFEKKEKNEKQIKYKSYGAFKEAKKINQNACTFIIPTIKIQNEFLPSNSPSPPRDDKQQIFKEIQENIQLLSPKKRFLKRKSVFNINFPTFPKFKDVKKTLSKLRSRRDSFNLEEASSGNISENTTVNIPKSQIKNVSKPNEDNLNYRVFTEEQEEGIDFKETFIDYDHDFSRVKSYKRSQSVIFHEEVECDFMQIKSLNKSKQMNSMKLFFLEAKEEVENQIKLNRGYAEEMENFNL